jgi:hypothetical protein
MSLAVADTASGDCGLWRVVRSSVRKLKALVRPGCKGAARSDACQCVAEPVDVAEMAASPQSSDSSAVASDESAMIVYKAPPQSSPRAPACTDIIVYVAPLVALVLICPIPTERLFTAPLYAPLPSRHVAALDTEVQLAPSECASIVSAAFLPLDAPPRDQDEKALIQDTRACDVHLTVLAYDPSSSADTTRDNSSCGATELPSCAVGAPAWMTRGLAVPAPAWLDRADQARAPARAPAPAPAPHAGCIVLRCELRTLVELVSGRTSTHPAVTGEHTAIARPRTWAAAVKA